MVSPVPSPLYSYRVRLEVSEIVLPLPVLRERAGVRVFTGNSGRKTLTPTLSRSTGGLCAIAISSRPTIEAAVRAP